MNRKRQIRDMGHGTQDTGFATRDSGLATRDSGLATRSSGLGGSTGNGHGKLVAQTADFAVRVSSLAPENGRRSSGQVS